MSTDFRHGVDVSFQAAPAPPVLGADLSVIGLVGTALQGDYGRPVLIRSRGEGVAEFGASGGTIPDALAAIYDQGAARVVVVNIFDRAMDLTTVTDEAVANVDGLVALAHQQVSAVTVTSTDSATTYVEGTHYTLDAAAGTITRIADGAGVYAANANLLVDYKWLDISQVSAADAIGSAAGSRYSGMFAMLDAPAATGLVPRILCAPGFTRTAGTAVGMLPVADRLRATLVCDAPSTDDEAATAYRELFDSRRAFIVEPRVSVASGPGTVLEWASARTAGTIARADADVGWWRSPSNRVMAGVTGTERSVDYSADATSRANWLNARQIATVVRVDQGGFRLWGNRVASSDPSWQFITVARTADAIEDALERSFLWAVDRGLRATFFEEVAEAVNAYLRDLAGRGAILGGSCSPSDSSLNSEANIKAGKAHFDVEFTPPVPAERINFRVALNPERYGALAGGRQ